MKSLCDTCDNRFRIEAHEAGVVYDVCRPLDKRISELGIVKKCSKYDGKDYPWLFAKQAAVLHIDSGKATWWTDYSSHRVIRGRKPKGAEE